MGCLVFVAIVSAFYYLVIVVYRFCRRSSCARHEAGHVVVFLASVGGVKVHKVVLTSSFNPLIGGYVSSETLDDSSTTLWGYIAGGLAGFAAVPRHREGSESDFRHCREVIGKLMDRQAAGEDIRPPWQDGGISQPFTADGIFEVCERRARQLVEDRARQVDALVEALLRRGRLDGAEIDAILADLN